MKTWFTADWHLGHKNIIDHCNRPFKTIAHMDDYIINNCLKQVKNNDVVYYLGDFAWRDWYYKVLLPQLPGKWIFVPGNHDWEFQKRNNHQKLLDIKLYGRNFTLCHYPLITWYKQRYHAIHLHGHCHGTLQEYNVRRIDVGVDCWRYKLVDYDTIIDRIKT